MVFEFFYIYFFASLTDVVLFICEDIWPRMLRFFDAGESLFEFY